jgi:hypothetical protein
MRSDRKEKELTNTVEYDSTPESRKIPELGQPDANKRSDRNENELTNTAETPQSALDARIGADAATEELTVNCREAGKNSVGVGT